MEWEIKLDKVSGIGKNNYGVSRNGIHYPKKNFVMFRNEMLKQIMDNKRIEQINKPCHLTLLYNPKDKRRRDATAILDAIFHILENAGVVKDDSLIKKIDYIEILDKNDDNWTFMIKIMEVS